jgi:cytochrome c oxidase subunit II
MNTENLVSHGDVMLPAPGSDFHTYIDPLFNFIHYGSIFLFVVITAVMLYFIVKYRRSAENPRSTSDVDHNTTLEIAWSVIPLILVMFLFAWGWKGFMEMAIPPSDATELRVTAKKWQWDFDYPERGLNSPRVLAVPVDVPIKLVMSSEDVLHSFFVPNFRVKRDVVPFRSTVVWFTARRVGTFQVFCTEYCGDGHSKMLAEVRVLSAEDYVKWQEEQERLVLEMPILDLGKRVYNMRGCATCHSLDGTVLTGPSWKGIYGESEKMQDGTTITVDENYLRESIMDPAQKIVAGFTPSMPTFAGALKEREIQGVVEYIKTIK